MRIKNHIIVSLFILITLPILLSLDSKAYDSMYLAEYKSPEGIAFLSYSNSWDEQKLKLLYEELIKNKHGKELFLLQEVQIRGDENPYDSLTRGMYHALTNTITLYHGDKYTTPSAFSETLSHEYGHHFMYNYLKQQHFPFTEWSRLRNLSNMPIRYDAFWNYSTAHHPWYPQEIIADDYVLLYGPTKPVNIEDVFTNEAFYVNIQHDNQELTNVLDNEELHHFLEEMTGVPVEQNRKIKTPTLLEVSNNGTLLFKIEPRANIAYRLNLDFYKYNGASYSYDSYHEILIITSQNNLDEISYEIEKLVNKKYIDQFTGYIEVSLNVLDLNTSLGFKTRSIQLKIEEHQLQSF